MIIGYVRKFSFEENTQVQIDLLTQYNCEVVYHEHDHFFGDTTSVFQEVITRIVPGDKFVVYNLGVIGQNSSDLLSFIKSLETRGVDFISISDHIDTGSEAGKLICHGLNCLFQFERTITRERTISGIKLAKAKGKSIGKPKGLSSNAELLAQKAEALYHKGFSVSQIATKLNISRQTIYNYLKYRSVQFRVTA